MPLQHFKTDKSNTHNMRSCEKRSLPLEHLSKNLPYKEKVIKLSLKTSETFSGEGEVLVTCDERLPTQ